MTNPTFPSKKIRIPVECWEEIKVMYPKAVSRTKWVAFHAKPNDVIEWVEGVPYVVTVVTPRD